MYMEPIVAAKPLPTLAQRRLVGSVLVLLGVAVLLPWLALCGVLAGTVFALHVLRMLPRAFAEAVDHVGDYAHGL